MNTDRNYPFGGRDLWVIAGIVGAIALAWSGLLDGLSAKYIDNALLGSGAIYATARGINALVSVLQGTEMNAFVLTFTVGELLDPINDLIERFSGVMMLALGSLALQKILLEVVSDSIFNVLLTTLGAGVIVTRFIGPPGAYRLMAKFFGITVVIRFCIAAVILANSWADTVFIEKNVNERHETMQLFHDELGLVGARAGIETGLADEIREVEIEITRNQKAQADEKQRQYLNRTRLEEAIARLEAVDKRSWWEKVRGDTTIEIEGLKATIRRLEVEIDGSKFTQAGLQERRDALDEKHHCLRKRAQGDSCSLFESVQRTTQAFRMKEQIDALVEQVDDFASNLINLLMALLLKSVILPLLLLYALVRSVKYIFD